MAEYITSPKCSLQIDPEPQVITHSLVLLFHTFKFKTFSSKDGKAARAFPAYALYNSFHCGSGDLFLTISIQKFNWISTLNIILD